MRSHGPRGGLRELWGSGSPSVIWEGLKGSLSALQIHLAFRSDRWDSHAWFHIKEIEESHQVWSTV